MKKLNRHNLPRHIPERVKREVRQRDGFGCIACGSMFYQYDHLGTEFKDAEVHDARNIVLLCGGCHDRKTRGMLSTETLLLHAKSPRCRQTNFSWGPLDIGHEAPEIIIGTISATNCKSLLTINGKDIFSISRPHIPGGPFNVNATLYDRRGRCVIKIENNEFKTAICSWDVEVIGPRINVRSAPGKFDMVIRAEPPRRLVIERLDMAYKNFSIRSREGHSTVIETGGTLLKAGGYKFDGCDRVINVDHSGLYMGEGGGLMIIENLVINMT